MSDRILRIAGALLTLLAVMELVPPFDRWLPLGGNNATQMAIVLGLAAAVAEMFSIWRNR